MDSALDDFLKRFGDDDPNKFMTQNTKRQPVSSVMSDTGFSAKGLTGNLTSGLEDVSLGNNLKTESSPLEETGSENKISDGLSKAASALPSAMSLISNAKGDQFDTSAEGGGPGKAGGAIMGGAASGMQLASSIGLKDPLSQGIAALGGGLISTFAHKGAMKEYRENQKKANRSENALEKAKREEEYAQSEGLASLNNLKALRQKQLGIIK